MRGALAMRTAFLPALVAALVLPGTAAAQVSSSELREGAAKDDVSVTPLGVPLLAGPGAISTVIVYESQAQGLGQTAMVYGVIAAVSVLSYAVFWAFLKGARRVNPLMMNIVTRLMGLLLAATGVEFILGGLAAAGVIKG